MLGESSACGVLVSSAPGASDTASLVRLGLTWTGFRLVERDDSTTHVIVWVAGDSFATPQRRVRAATPQQRAKLLVVLPRPDAELEAAMLDAGADDCVTRYQDLDLLRARVSALCRQACASLGRIVVGRIVVDGHRGAAAVDGKQCTLTWREFKLLQLLAQNANRTVASSEILERWGATSDPSSNLVNVHVARLRRKLGPAGEQLETKVGRGFVLKD